MEQLVLKVGRNLAPHLRYVIGPWLCAQFDTYAVVASSGKKSFQAAFSDEKQAEVIMFCRKELFEVCFRHFFLLLLLNCHLSNLLAIHWHMMLTVNSNIHHLLQLYTLLQ